MSKKNRNPNRTGFLNYCLTIAGIERDKDEFCKAARIPRNGADMFGNLDGVIRHLTRERAKDNLFVNEYLQALDRIQRMIDAQNAHELRMAQIAVKKSEESIL